MKLRTRILLAAGLTLSCLIAAIYLLSSRLLLSSYADLERQDAARSLQQAVRAFGQLAADLHAKSADWAESDDTCDFMKSHNQETVRTLASAASMASMNLDLVAFLNPDGSIYYTAPSTRLRHVAAPSAQRVVTELGSARILASRKTRGGGFYGAIALAGAPPMLVSVRPILCSRGTGPARGWLILGRCFDEAAEKNLAGRTRLDIRTWGLKDGPLPDDGVSAVRSLGTPGASVIRPLNDWSLACYTCIRDVAGRPIYLMRVMLTRSIYRQGAQSVRYLMRYILLASFVYSVVILITLEVCAFSRLARLTRQVERVDANGTLARVDLPGRDELTELAQTINGMLASLEQNSKQLRESEENLRLYNENLEQTVVERTRQIEYQAFHDALTGLANRALFMNRLEVARARRKRGPSTFAVIFADLHKFKYINDTLGHEAGDQLLKEVALRITQCVRVGDTVARLGSDEFTILMETVDSPQDAACTAQRISDALAAPFQLGEHAIYATVRIGVAINTEETESADALLRNAGTAMHEAKAGGRPGHVMFDRSMRDHGDERSDLERELRFALDRDEFFLQYQPLICLSSSGLVGVEALLRWSHPGRGTVPPGKFIPIAEETGLILPIGYWVLEQACAQAKRWREEFPELDPFVVNVNLSGKQLQRSDIVMRVAEILERTGVDPPSIKLEITESVMMTDLEVTVQRLYGLKELGVKLAMDDFGTGYSCLANMDTFPLDTIKIDRSFVQRLTNLKDGSSQLIRAIIAISRSLKMDVTGEGVETLEQAAQLKALGCDTVQGYFYSRPLSAEAIQRYLAGCAHPEITVLKAA